MSINRVMSSLLSKGRRVIIVSLVIGVFVLIGVLVFTFRHHSNSIVVALDNPLLCSVVFLALASEGTDGMEDLHHCTWDWLASAEKGIGSVDGLLLLEAFPRGIGLCPLIKLRDTGFKQPSEGVGKFLVIIPASKF